jgi:mRNA interferase MazF
MKRPTGARRSDESRGKAPYLPDAGDLVWCFFSPQVGREQAGRWPALVLSPRSYNAKAGLCLLCPITNQAKAYPFEVGLPADLSVAGVVLSDHVKSADWQGRLVEPAGVAPPEVLAEVRAKLRPLLGI